MSVSTAVLSGALRMVTRLLAPSLWPGAGCLFIMIYYSQYAPAASLDSRSRIIAIGRAPRAAKYNSQDVGKDAKYNSQDVGKDYDSELAVRLARGGTVGHGCGQQEAVGGGERRGAEPCWRRLFRGR